MIYLVVGIAVVLGALALLPALRSRASPVPHISVPPEEIPADVDAITPKLANQRRVAYSPIVADNDGPADGSKFSGVPGLASGEAWPECANCGRPMQLFVQLAGKELPAPAQLRVGPDALLQFFYCTSETPHCESECDAYSPHSRSTLLRIVPVAGKRSDTPLMPAGMFPPKRVVGWTEEDDYPSPDELSDLGSSLTDAEVDTLSETFPRFGEKLLGWPAWVQAVDYPNCRVCGQRMDLLFQLDSEHNLPYMFGDAGVGHITQCPAHPAELAFGWACH